MYRRNADTQIQELRRNWELNRDLAALESYLLALRRSGQTPSLFWLASAYHAVLLQLLTNALETDWLTEGPTHPNFAAPGAGSTTDAYISYWSNFSPVDNSTLVMGSLIDGLNEIVYAVCLTDKNGFVIPESTILELSLNFSRRFFVINPLGDRNIGKPCRYVIPHLVEKYYIKTFYEELTKFGWSGWTVTRRNPDESIRRLEREAQDWPSKLRAWRTKRRHGILEDITLPIPVTIRISPSFREQWEMSEEGSWEDHGSSLRGYPGYVDEDGVIHHHGVEHIYVILERFKTKISLNTLEEIRVALYSLHSSTLYLHVSNRALDRVYNAIENAALNLGFTGDELRPRLGDGI